EERERNVDGDVGGGWTCDRERPDDAQRQEATRQWHGGLRNCTGRNPRIRQEGDVEKRHMREVRRRFWAWGLRRAFGPPRTPAMGMPSARLAPSRPSPTPRRAGSRAQGRRNP